MMRAGLIQGRMGPAIFLELGLQMANRSHQRARSEEGKLRHFLDHLVQLLKLLRLCGRASIFCLFYQEMHVLSTHYGLFYG